jgi:hypothetical protein
MLGNECDRSLKLKSGVKFVDNTRKREIPPPKRKKQSLNFLMLLLNFD